MEAVAAVWAVATNLVEQHLDYLADQAAEVLTLQQSSLEAVHLNQVAVVEDLVIAEARQVLTLINNQAVVVELAQPAEQLNI
jgi:hypothetical protein